MGSLNVTNEMLGTQQMSDELRELLQSLSGDKPVPATDISEPGDVVEP